MMFLKIRDFIFFGVFSLLAFAGLGAGSYATMQRLGNKFLAERFLFFSLLAAATLLFLLYRVYASSRRARRDMEIIVDMARYSGVLPEDRLEKFGDIGRNLRYLYRELGELSGKRAERIYLFATLAEGLMDFIEAPVLVVESTGKVLFADAAFMEKLGDEAPPAAGRRLEEILPELDFKALLHEADRTHLPVEVDTGLGQSTFYPVHDRTNIPALFIAAFGRTRVFSLPEKWKKREEPQARDPGPAPGRGFFGFFPRRGKTG